MSIWDKEYPRFRPEFSTFVAEIENAKPAASHPQ